jgi:hypothetical protein
MRHAGYWCVRLRGSIVRCVLPVTLCGIICFSTAAPAQAQPPHPPPGGTFPSYNYERAYRHFLNSPYSYRTFSSLGTASAGQAWTPFGVQGYYVDPSYEHQRMTPFGFERYTAVPGYGGYTVSPFGYRSYYVPGYGYQVFAPPPPGR